MQVHLMPVCVMVLLALLKYSDLFLGDRGDKNYLIASDYWIQVTLEMANYNDGYAGYKTYSSEGVWWSKN